MYSVIAVPEHAAEISEQMGTKYKFWYRDERLGRALFKEGRPGTGENWAEKLACELASEIRMPSAQYELATFRDKLGTVTPTLVQPDERIVHGNEILAVVHPNYVSEEGRYRQRQHSVTAVLGLLRTASTHQSILVPSSFETCDRISSALDVFVGYLMFDTWIGNQDRHDQNWGISRSIAHDRIHLLPSYDHGSSLNRNEVDELLLERLKTNDRGRHISTHVRKARSALYPRAGDDKPKALLTTEAFLTAARLRPNAATAWVERLEAIDDRCIDNIVERMPSLWMSDTAKLFVKEYLRLNRTHLLEMDFKK